MKFNTGFSSLRGVLLELAWHHELREGGDWTLKNLETGKTQDVNVAPQSKHLLAVKLSLDYSLERLP
jgi:hypothetical protein